MALTPPLSPPGTQPTPQEARVERRRLRWLWLALSDPKQRHRLLLVGGLLIVGVVGVLGYVADRTQTLPGDLYVTLELQEVQATMFRNAMFLVSLPGYSPWGIWTVVIGAVAVGLRLGWRDGAFLALLVGIQGFANHLIKTAFGRPRPAENLVEVFLPNHGNSFPSGHVMFYTVFFGFLFFLAWSRLPRGWGRGLTLVLSGLMVLLVGPSRIFLGAHWFSDVMAALLLGLLFLALGIELYITRVAPSPRIVAQQAVPPTAPTEPA